MVHLSSVILWCYKSSLVSPVYLTVQPLIGILWPYLLILNNAELSDIYFGSLQT